MDASLINLYIHVCLCNCMHVCIHIHTALCTKSMSVPMVHTWRFPMATPNHWVVQFIVINNMDV